MTRKNGSKKRMAVTSLSEQLSGRVIQELVHDSADSITLRFQGGASLEVQQSAGRLNVTFNVAEEQRRPGRRASDPTPRQKEYLDFIKKYMARFGVSPAETDIHQHFMVSPPSAHQMIRTLERRGFITRDHGWYGQALPRSIRVVWEDD